MSRYFSEKYNALAPYVPGEQPQDRQYIKLNSNESPFPPSEGVLRAASDQAEWLQLYSDPECMRLRSAMANLIGRQIDEIMMVNGSDEALNFAFMAFADKDRPLYFADITYGFYPVFARLNHIPYTEIPLRDDFSIDPSDYMGKNGVIAIANPNAPTGKCLGVDAIEAIVRGNPNGVVIVDEAYVDFGGESAIPLIDKYDNLLVVGTFSKSRSMAGARLGFAVGNRDLIADLNVIRYSTNPYNVNRMTMAAGEAAIAENDYYMNNCRTIMENRQWTSDALAELGFTVLPSCTNFIFAKSDRIGGDELYRKLKQRGVLVRYFNKDRIRDYNRITIGTRAQMETMIARTREILEEA